MNLIGTGEIAPVTTIVIVTETVRALEGGGRGAGSRATTVADPSRGTGEGDARGTLSPRPSRGETTEKAKDFVTMTRPRPWSRGAEPSLLKQVLSR